MNNSINQDKTIWDEINSQTARIEWSVLEPHYAKGAVIWVAPELDLVKMAVRLVQDNAGLIEPLIKHGKFAQATDGHAQDWSDRNPVLWAVVVPPWVLVQEKPDDAIP